MLGDTLDKNEQKDNDDNDDNENIIVSWAVLWLLRWKLKVINIETVINRGHFNSGNLREFWI